MARSRHLPSLLERSETAYVQPFRDQPWRVLWWLDDVAHRCGVHLPWVCDRLDRELGGPGG